MGHGGEWTDKGGQSDNGMGSGQVQVFALWRVLSRALSSASGI